MSKRSVGRAWLVRGESLVASVGLALAAILLAVTASSALWTLHSQGRFIERAREAQIRAVAGTLAPAVEQLLAGRDLAGARLLLVTAAAEHGLASCRIVLPDGRTLADIDPSGPAERELPESWDGEAPEPVAGTTPGSVSVPLAIPGRGKAALFVHAEPATAGPSDWEAETGVGAIGVIGLLALLGVYRSVRRRLAVLGAIGEALAAAQAGESDTAALRISEGFGPGAAAWNRLLDERDELRRRQPAEADSSPGPRRGQDEALYSACDAMWQGLLLVDDRLRVKYANGAAANFLGLRRESLIGSEAAAALGDPAVAESVVGVARGTSRQRSTMEVRRQGDRGDCVLRFSVRPVRREDSAAAMVLIEDVTQQRVADEARNAFVAQATHELRTPLTNIALYVETLVEDAEADPATRAKCLNVIGQEVKRLERIVGDMLSVSQIEAGSLKLASGDVRLGALFEEIEADYRAQAQDKDISLTFQLPPKLPVIQGDRDKIVLALHNLLGNALKYTPAGGAVTVTVEETAGRLSIAIADNGIGIRDEELELVFEKFYRAKDKRLANITGSGLGLALARQVARMHGGDVTVRSAIDKGSTFTMALPVAAAGVAMRAAA